MEKPSSLYTTPFLPGVLFLLWRVRGTVAACSPQWGQWGARLTALLDRCTWKFTLPVALLPCWYLPGKFPLPSSRKTFPHKGQRVDVTSEHSEQHQEKLNSRAGHINTPRQISVNLLIGLMCPLLPWLWSGNDLIVKASV